MAVLLAVDGLVSKEKMRKPYDFKKARLVRSNSSYGWYVLFYVWDVQKGGLVRKRKFLPLELTTKEAKEAYAKDIVHKINVILKEGYHIDRSRKLEDTSDVVQSPTLTIEQTLPRYLNYCQNIAKNTEKELGLKLGEIKKFMRWIADNDLAAYNLSDVSTEMAQHYFDYLVEVNGVAPKTYNNIRGRLKNFFNVARKRKWTTAENPFDLVDRQATNYGERNTAFSDAQLAEIVPYIKTKDPYLWKFICFIYYAFMRPSEIRRLKIKNIDMEKRHIRILSSQSKVRKFDILPIADGLYQELLDMDLANYSQENYLFSTCLHPAEKPLGNGWTTEHFKLIKQHFDLGLEYFIYGFKHTAVCRWYMHEKDIVRIQKMCRHSTIEMTARYLKSLGLLTDQYKIESLPGLEF